MVAVTESVIWLASSTTPTLRAYEFAAPDTAIAEIAFPYACSGRSVSDGSGDVILACVDRVARVRPTGAVAWTLGADTSTFGAVLVDVTHDAVTFEDGSGLHSVGVLGGAERWAVEESFQACNFGGGVMFTHRDRWERLDAQTGATLGTTGEVTHCQHGHRLETVDARNVQLIRLDGASWVLKANRLLGLDSAQRAWGISSTGVVVENQSGSVNYCASGTSFLVGDVLLNVDTRVSVLTEENWVELNDIEWADRPLHVTAMPGGFVVDGAPTSRPLAVWLLELTS